jgi:hypothetical protein
MKHPEFNLRDISRGMYRIPHSPLELSHFPLRRGRGGRVGVEITAKYLEINF